MAINVYTEQFKKFDEILINIKQNDLKLPFQNKFASIFWFENFKNNEENLLGRFYFEF